MSGGLLDGLKDIVEKVEHEKAIAAGVVSLTGCAWDEAMEYARQLAAHIVTPENPDTVH